MGSSVEKVLGVRPEDLALSAEGAEMTVTLVEELGADAYIYGTSDVEGAVRDVAPAGGARATDDVAEARVELGRTAGDVCFSLDNTS